MTIAILRTTGADAADSYNRLEYAAVQRGVRIAGYVDRAHRQATFRGYPVLQAETLASRGVEQLVTVDEPDEDTRRWVRERGVPDDRVLSFDAERPRWHALASGSAWLIHREPRLTADGLTFDVHEFEMLGLAVEAMPAVRRPDELRDISARVVASTLAAHQRAPDTGPYAVGRNWGNFLRHTRPTYYEALARGDVGAIDGLLAHFFRNELSTGIFGGADEYSAVVRAGVGLYEGTRQQFHVWRHSGVAVDVGRLASPLVGDPYGVRVGDRIVHPNTFTNDARAAFLLGLVAGIERPVIVELGGGFGGLGHQLFAHGASPVYVDFDLPDNLLVAAYFLSAAHPDKRVLLYDGTQGLLTRSLLLDFDIVLMPHFALTGLDDLAADLFVNLISLAEMDHATVVEYLRQVERVCAGFFYHENLLENGDSYEAYPVQTFPELASFKAIYATPSRWPFFGPASPYHCHGERLLIRRDLDASRFFGPAHRTAPACA
jgi:hypothetical protein